MAELTHRVVDAGAARIHCVEAGEGPMVLFVPSVERSNPWSGTVAERRGWMGNDLLNATNTAIGAAFVCLFARVFP